MTLERSPWTLSVMAASIVLLAVAMATPWYTFHHSTGRQVPPGTEAEEPAQERRIAYHPYAARGDLSAAQRADAARPVQILGVLATIPLTLATVNLIVEVFGGMGERTRIVQLWIAALGSLAVVAALAFVWLVFPSLLADEGVDGVFTSRNDQGTFIRSSLSWGWTMAAVSLVMHAATFAFKYAGGVFTLAFLDRFRSDPR